VPPYLTHYFVSCSSLAKEGRRIIDIDPSYPGDQGEGVFAFNIANFRFGGHSWKEAIELEMLADNRDVEQDLYNIVYFEGSNEAILSKPILPAGFQLDAAEYDPRQANKDVLEGHQQSRTAYSKMPASKQVKEYVLRFKHDVKLTEVPFGAGGVGGNKDEPIVAEPKMVIYRKGTGKFSGEHEIMTVHTRVTWKFGDSTRAISLTASDRPGQKASDEAFAGL
jgi:hypothetical protein